jgi:hypothetical protein
MSTTWSTRRCLVIGALLLAAWCWAAGQGSAHQAGDPDPSYGTTLDLEHAGTRQQRISDQSCRFLIARGFPVGPCPRVYVTDDLEDLHGGPSTVVAVATAAGTVLDPFLVQWGREVAALMGGSPVPSETELRVHLHELLHRIQAVRAHGVDQWGRVELEHWRWTAWERQVEEWAVEAVTMDLLPIAVAKADPGLEITADLDAYAAGVRSFRAMSARAVGTSWRSRQARSWRAWFVRQDVSIRMDALASLGVQP